MRPSGALQKQLPKSVIAKQENRIGKTRLVLLQLQWKHVIALKEDVGALLH